MIRKRLRATADQRQREAAEFRNTALVIVANLRIVLPPISVMYLRNLSHKIVLTETVNSHSFFHTKHLSTPKVME